MLFRSCVQPGSDTEDVDRRLSRGGLCRPAARSAAAGNLPTVDAYDTFVDSVVLRTTGRNDVVAWKRSVARLRPLLEHRLDPLAEQRSRRSDLGGKVHMYESCSRGESVCEKDRSDDRLEGRSEGGRATCASTLAFADTYVHGFVQPQASCNLRERLAAHDSSTALRKIALARRRVCRV